MKRIMYVLGLFFCIAVSTSAGEQQAATITVDRLPVTMLRIIDGDTIEVWDTVAGTTIRLLGIDTPEMRSNPKAKFDAREWRVSVDDITHSGWKARDFVLAIAPPGIKVGVECYGEDDYGRTLAYVYLPDGRCLNDILLRYGVALAPARYRHVRQGEFAEIEKGAREQKRGFWKTIWKNL